MPRFIPSPSGRLIAAALSLSALGAVATFAPKVARAEKPAASTVPQIKFTQYTLKNGLRVVLSPDTRKDAPPVIAVNVTYNVGSRSERPGRSGFAHLFEHMMFQGAENIAKQEHIYLVQSNGGSMNGTTNQDRTNFFETLPSNQLELAFFLESDRMRSLDISESNLINQRKVVQEEKRQSYDNRAYGHADEALLDLAYSSFPYKHTTIGSMADLDAATLADVRDFHQQFYEPNNAVLTVTGKFDERSARKMIDRYFGPIAAGTPAPVTVFNEPTLYPGERVKKMTDPLARQTQYLSGYLTVSGTDPDYYALRILGDILSGGRTGRLYKALVDPGVANSASARMGEALGPDLFNVSMTITPNGDLARAQSVLSDEIQKVQQSGVTQDEIDTALARERIEAIRSAQTALGLASRIGLDAVLFNDPNRVNETLPKLQAVTPADVQRVAIKYLVPANRSVVITEPEAGDDAGFGGVQ